MASYDRLPSGRWRARVWDEHAGRLRSRTFIAKTAALAWAREAESQVRDGQYAQADRTTVLEWSERWFDARVVELSTRKNDEVRLRLHVLPTFGPMALEALTHHDVQTWVRALERAGKGPALIRSSYALLSAMLGDAVRAGLVKSNPAREVRLPPLPPARETFLTRDEVDEVAAAMSTDTYRLAFLLLPYTGIRWGELAGVRVNRVDLLRRRLRVAETIVEVDGHRTVKAYSKTKRDRMVPLAPWLADEIGAYLGRHPAGPRDLLLRTRTGEPLSRNNFGVGVRGAVRAANKTRVEANETRPKDDPLPPLPPFRIHDLRHTFASWLVQDGVPLYEVARLLGHGSIRTTERYAHLAPEIDDKVIRSLLRDNSVTSGAASR